MSSLFRKVDAKDFDRIHAIGSKLREILERDDVSGLDGMEDYLVRAVEEATHTVSKSTTCSASYHLSLAKKGDTRCGVCKSPLRY